MEETRNKDDAMRKNMRQSTEEKRVQKSKTLSENFEFVWAKNRYGGDEKKG